MFGKAARGSCLHVAEEANLQRNSFVEDVLREVAQFDYFAVFRDGDVFDQPRAVADAVRSAVLNGLPNRFFSKAFAGVNGDVEILALDVVKRVDVFFGRITALLAGQIEAHDSTFAKIDGELGHFERHVHVAHGTDDQSGSNSKVPAAAFEALQHSGDDLLVAQSFSRVKDRGEASLKIDDAVAAQIFRLFVGDAFERFFGLHYGDGVDKAFEIFWEAPLVRSLVEPVRELFRVFGGKLSVSFASGQLDDRFRAEDAVEVLVEQNLGEGLQEGVIKRHWVSCPYKGFAGPWELVIVASRRRGPCKVARDSGTRCRAPGRV